MFSTYYLSLSSQRAGVLVDSIFLDLEAKVSVTLSRMLSATDEVWKQDLNPSSLILELTVCGYALLHVSCKVASNPSRRNALWHYARGCCGMLQAAPEGNRDLRPHTSLGGLQLCHLSAV